MGLFQYCHISTQLWFSGEHDSTVCDVNSLYKTEEQFEKVRKFLVHLRKNQHKRAVLRANQSFYPQLHYWPCIVNFT